MTELRVYLPIDALMPQFAAYLATPTRARGYPPRAGDMSLIVEVAPALAIHRIADFALKAAPELEPGLLFTERQFGVLELHARDRGLVETAARAVLKGLGAAPMSDQSIITHNAGNSSRRRCFPTSSRRSATSTPLSSTAPVKPR